MKKSLLSIITSASLIASMVATNAFAAPSVMGNLDYGTEYVPEIPMEEAINENNDSELLFEGPQPVESNDSVYELNSEFGTPDLWDSDSLFSELSGDGTEESPYLITNVDDLKTMANNVNKGLSSDAYYKLTADIDLGGEEWIPIGHYGSEYETSFRGVFDGNGHTVSNFVITKDDTAYIGFFGLVSCGTIKGLNIDNVTISIESESMERLYVSPLAGRIVVNDSGKSGKITHCNVTNASVKVSNYGTIYAGGIAGSTVAGGYRDADIFIAFSNADSDFDITSAARGMLVNLSTGVRSYHIVAVGGIVGYFGSSHGAKISAINCHADTNIEAFTTNSDFASTMTGGAFGDLRSYADKADGGLIEIDSCSAKGNVNAEAKLRPYVTGGFAGQFYATEDAYISNSYSRADTSGTYILKGKYEALDPTAGGFFGQVFFPNYSSDMGKTVKNCYASGDAIDTTHTEESPLESSYVGRFSGYSTSGIFENCYKLESQTVCGSDVFYDDISLLTEEQATDKNSYAGFDFTNTWTIDTSSDYGYPVLAEKTGYATFMVNNNLFYTSVFASDGKVIKPETDPEKYLTVEHEFEFSHWSLTENGAEFNFKKDTVSENAIFYAVFYSYPREYKLSFISEGTQFVPDKTLVYGSTIVAPVSIPTKPDNGKYTYEFLHWSAIVGGEAFDFTTSKINSDTVLHAVFKEIDTTEWTGNIADKFENGYGSEALPYVISSSEEFALFAKVINEQIDGYTDAYYVLDADINLGGNYWVPIGKSFTAPFSANFDGKGYSVSNFKVVSEQYAGLFGCVLNGTIKNLYLNKFEIDYSYSSSIKKFQVFVGGLAGYITSASGTTNISGIRIESAKFEINADVDYIYAGNIAGYVSASSLGKTYISDSFATTPITVNTKTGYSYAGGLVGRMDTGGSAVTLMTHCYNLGSIVSNSYHSSHAGGLVGHLYSYGSAYSPPAVISEDAVEEDNADLSVEDVDIMITESFAIASVTSNSSHYDSNVGRILGSDNQHAAIENVFYPSDDPSVVITPFKENLVGYSTALSNLKSKDYLSQKRGFDFENTWTYDAESGLVFPVLKCMVSDKPVLKLISTSLDKNTVNAKVKVLSREESFTVIVGIYNSRNQLIGVKRTTLSGSDVAYDLDFVFDKVPYAKTISISAYSGSSYAPIFDSIKTEL